MYFSKYFAIVTVINGQCPEYFAKIESWSAFKRVVKFAYGPNQCHNTKMADRQEIRPFLRYQLHRIASAADGSNFIDNIDERFPSREIDPKFGY